MIKRWLRSVGFLLLFIVLLALPTLIRAGYYYRRAYAPPFVPRPDQAAIELPTAEVAPFEDGDIDLATGSVIIDHRHGNAVEDAELNLLLSRLTARGVRLVSNLDGPADAPWLPLLRTAKALIVISPHQRFLSEEVEAIEGFVERGGRVLLVGDPSRYTFKESIGDLGDPMVAPESDVPALNSLAASFGLTFADDYIYNTAENAGNYQYVIMRDFAQDGSSLTLALDEIVFYAARSIATDEETLIWADENTSSSLGEQGSSLAVVSLGGDGRVLAVADFTFMTEPHNETADNNRLISNIADFLAAAQQDYDLAAFPAFLDEDVELLVLSGAADEGTDAIVAQVSRVQATLEAADKRLQWDVRPTSQRDVLYLGLYQGLLAQSALTTLLAGDGITFALPSAELADALPLRTVVVTPEGSVTPSPTPEALRDWIYLEGLGRVDARSNVLIHRGQQRGHVALVVLGYDPSALAAAVGRLIDGLYADCLLEHGKDGDEGLIRLALCPTVYQGPEIEPTPTPTPEVPGEVMPTPEAGRTILIVSDDDGEGVYEQWTSAYDLADVVNGAGYEAVLWSTSLDGQVTLDQMRAQDAVIWCTGDYREDGAMPEEGDLSNLIAYLSQGGRVILGGAFIGDPAESQAGLLLDIQVAQAEHPLAEGFSADQVVTLQRFTAEEDYKTFVLTETDPASIVFVRGPESEFAGEAVITISEDVSAGSRMVWIGVPLYLLPFEDEMQLANNALGWVMGQ